MDDEYPVVDIPADGSPMEFFLAVMRDPKQPYKRRKDCAVAAAPFVHAKFAVTTATTPEDIGDRLRRALEATGKVIEGRVIKEIPAPVVTPTPVQEPQQVSAEHMKRPMVGLDTNRFRRI